MFRLFEGFTGRVPPVQQEALLWGCGRSNTCLASSQATLRSGAMKRAASGSIARTVLSRLHAQRLNPQALQGWSRKLPYSSCASTMMSSGGKWSHGTGTHDGSSDHGFRLLDLMARISSDMGDSECKFQLGVRESTIPNAGRGVFLQQGHVSEGDIITLYPGTIYRLPYDLEALYAGDDAFDMRPPDILVANEYLLRFKHGGPADKPSMFLIDGCPRGISALAYLRVLEARGYSANQSWLEEPDLMPDTPSSPAERQLALGNLINDPGTLGGENVRFEVLSVPRDMPAPLLSLLPSVTVSGSGGMVMAVTAKRDMHAGDEPVELLVSYGADPKSMGYPI